MTPAEVRAKRLRFRSAASAWPGQRRWHVRIESEPNAPILATVLESRITKRVIVVVTGEQMRKFPDRWAALEFLTNRLVPAT